MSQSSYLNIKNGVINGAVRSFGQYFAFSLEQNPGSMSDKSPTHLIMAKDDHGTVQVGIAWERKMKRGDYVGYSMFSLIINDIMFENEMILSAFPCDRDGGYQMSFERKRQNTGGSSAGLAPPPADNQAAPAQAAA